jgi:hypothetical protein
MKKRITTVFALIALSTFSLTSCKDDAAEPFNQNEIPDGHVKVSLSVQVVPSSISTASTKKVSGLSKAKVTVSQSGDKKTIEVDESGIAVFPNLFEGTVSIYIEAEGYASVNETAYLGYEGSLDVENGIDSEVPGFSQITIDLPRLASNVKGTIYGDWDFNGGTNTTLSGSGAKVIARAPSSYQPSIYTATVTNGAFSFTNLPENVPLAFELDFQSTNTTATPNYSTDWEISGLNNVYLQADETKELGNITAYSSND